MGLSPYLVGSDAVGSDLTVREKKEEDRFFLKIIALKSRLTNISITSVQFSCSVMSDSLRPHESQHTRPPCLSPTPGAHLNPCPLSW